MPWENPQRNLNDSIRYGKLRQDIDTLHNEFHDAISQAFYDAWQLDISQVVTFGALTFDKKTTPAATLAYWAQLQRAMTHFYTVYFHQRNMEFPPNHPKRQEEEEYRYTYIDTDVVPPVVDEDLVQLAADQCIDLRDNFSIDLSVYYDVDIENI